jgi:hypothetical protein
VPVSQRNQGDVGANILLRNAKHGNKFKKSAVVQLVNSESGCHPERSRSSGGAKDLRLNHRRAQAKLHQIIAATPIL